MPAYTNTQLNFYRELIFYTKIHMITVFKNLYQYRELIAALAWKNIILRYKQAYLGILLALKPATFPTLYLLLRLCFLGCSFRSPLRKVSAALPPMPP